MDGNLLQLNDITRRVMKEMGGVGFTVDNETITVNDASERFALNGDIYYLASETIDIPIAAKLRIYSSDNFMVTSKTEFERDKSYFELESFRDYIVVEVENYGSTFVPFKLNFRKITPTYSKQ